MSSIRAITILGGWLVLMQFVVSTAFAQIPPTCAPYRCHCISTSKASQSGFGGARGNIGIQIRAINPKITSISVTNAYTGAAYFSGMPSFGQFIAVGTFMGKQAFAPNVGLMCAVRYWIIDYRNIPRR